MTFQSKIILIDQNEDYLTLESKFSESVHDTILSSIYNLKAMIDLGNHNFDDEIIDNLKMRIEELRKPKS